MENEGKGKDVHGGKNKDSGTNVMNTSNEKASDGKIGINDSNKMYQEGSSSMESSNEGGILGSNRFTLLESLVNEEELVPNADQRKIVDEFLCKKNDVNNMEMNDWSEDMKRYYRDKKELFDAAREIKENEDVLDENCGVENTVLRNEVEGVGVFYIYNSLVPKIYTPGKVSDFRPTACCNVLYKCISKIMTNRYKGVLGTLVNENQSAFIGGRKITDNILLAQELFRGYNMKQNVKKVSFKIDLQKSYDTISWEFLKDVFVMFGFHEKMVSWIMTCVTSTKFSININGKRVGYFKGVFCHGDCESVRIVKKSMDEFSGFSGLLPNMQKSTVFFGGLSSAEQQNILNIIPFSVGKLLASVFLLPKQVIYEIDKLLKGFLWCQGDLTKGKAKVSWNVVCKPKDQAAKKDTLWVKWIIMEKIKGRSIWEVQSNRKSVNVWHDRWCRVSPPSDFIETRDVYDARLSNKRTVSEVIHEGRFLWPDEWSNEFKELRQIKIPRLNDGIEDTAVWIYNDTKVDWFSMVWFAQSIPRHAFVIWLAIQNRLMTQDKLLIWRPNDDLKCVLCSKCPDSHNHFFFTCEFSKGIWNELLQMLNVRLYECGDQIINEIKALPANRNILGIVRRLACDAAVYYIWQEMNNRLFKNKKRDSNTILNTIKETFGMKLIGIKVKESRTVKEVEKIWNVKMLRG
ncbi:RNA-directed DNA polymerase, eukaryota, reverse transcriptase zinc-binding domain protein [Tanacetum coccineum]